MLTYPLAVLVLLSLSTNVFAAAFMGLNATHDDSRVISSIGLDFGATDVADNVPLIFEFSVAFDAQNMNTKQETVIPAGTIARPAVRRSDTAGFMLKSGYTVGKISYLGGLGFTSYFSKHGDLYTDVMGDKYFVTLPQKEYTNTNFQGYLGAMYRFDSLGINLGYNSQRGVVFGAGFFF